ncbi:polyprenyl synthetase [Halodesulfovibrio spirochaetisodalis]|uniref:Polyprenyl synthetase n=2 Tax=Halodesulfovibrio spirochaetisodalis TaxID=1560234 RepID=A0A1B7XQB6_9BACT|nr:farnesyl diphosphate synthase [Halodesulfovibrio spirochaetisodalis]OBQ57693.1 polyprenyl synthetase [Halodesulfovibrio spirochaetisodalis]
MMSVQEFKSMLKTEAGSVENYLSTCLHNRNIPQRLLASMEYSLLAGGKRLRPVLCLAVAAMCGASKEHVMPFASAIECIHSYSLVHDDLPAMDDDDLRRGKPSNHKAFDEATAILAGDGLLSEAFVLMSETAQHLPAASVLSALNTVAVAAGSGGMVGGQQLDMDFTGRDDVSLEELQTMHAMKTGALIRCSCESGAILGGATVEEQERIRTYGANIGAAFQIVDDILDETGTEEELGKPVGSDLEQGKNTYPSMLGIEKSRELAQKIVDDAVEQLAGFDGVEAQFLRKLAQYIVDRVS